MLTSSEPSSGPPSGLPSQKDPADPAALDPATAPFLAGDGEMARRMRALDWAKSPIGPIDQWPQSLRTAVSICLASKHPIEIWWGETCARIYNDAYRPMLGAAKHPQFLGRPGRECWGEIWHVIGPMLEGVRKTGKATWSEDFPLMIERNGFLEETFFTFSYAPVVIEDGSVGGIFCACTETTARVLAERRLRTLRHLAAQSAASSTLSVRETCEEAVRVLTKGDADVPFALIYEQQRAGDSVKLTALSGLEAGGPASPQTLQLEPEGGSGAASAWPLAAAARAGKPVRLALADGPLGQLPGGRFSEHAREALVLPLTRAGQGGSLGFLVVGISPRLALDEAYQSFFELAAASIATSISNAALYEEERGRVRRARLGSDAGVALTSSSPLPLQLRDCCEAMVKHLDAAFARIWTLDDAEQVLELRASAGLYQHLDGPHGRVPVGKYKIGLIAQEREPHLTNDVQVDPRVGDKGWAKREGMVSFAGYPLVVEGRLVGVMAMFARRPLGDETLNALASVADSIAVGIDRKRIEDARALSLERERAALAEAQRQRQRLQSLFLQAPNAIAILHGQDHVFELANPRYLELIGGRDVVGKPLLEALPELRGQAVPQLLDEVYRTGQPFVGNELPVTLERQGLREEGYFNLIYQPALDLAGRVEGILVIAYEVSEQVRSRKALEALTGRLSASEEHFRLLAEVQPQQVWSATPQGSLDFVNSRVTDYFARSFDRIIGEGWLDGLHPDDVPRTLERWTRSLKTGEPYENEFRIRRASDGMYRWHLALAQPMRDANGKIIRWFGSNTDLHDRKRTEVERERLIHALERSNKELDQFAYVASHDLKAPLRGIANLSAWLEEDLGAQITADAKGKLDKLRGRVHRMEGLIDGILDYSRAGRVRHKPEQVEVGRLLAEVTELLSPRAGARIEVQEGMPALHTEKVPLQQVFLNLIGNALKHASRNDPLVQVRVLDQGAFWRFTVQDNGQGIAPEFFERIWVIFQTLESRDKVEGAGIGLSVVKKIVESRGGTAFVESAKGQGAAFHFTWPKQHREELYDG